MRQTRYLFACECRNFVNLVARWKSVLFTCVIVRRNLLDLKLHFSLFSSCFLFTSLSEFVANGHRRASRQHFEWIIKCNYVPFGKWAVRSIRWNHKQSHTCLIHFTIRFRRHRRHSISDRPHSNFSKMIEFSFCPFFSRLPIRYSLPHVLWTRHSFNVYTKCVHFMRSAHHWWHERNG